VSFSHRYLHKDLSIGVEILVSHSQRYNNSISCVYKTHNKLHTKMIVVNSITFFYWKIIENKKEL